MKLRREEEGGEGPNIVFEELEPFFVDLLRQLPASADPGDDPAANERLFTSPVVDDDDNFNEDWQDFVEPEIRDLFSSAAQVVADDLKALPVIAPGKPPAPPVPGLAFDPALFAPGEGTFEFPRKHIDAWMSTLNQARLVIAAKNGFGEREMDEDLEFPPLTKRDFLLFQIHFYDFLQQVLLRELGFD